MPFKISVYQRLNKEEDFKKLIKKGKRIKGRFFFLSFLKNDFLYHRFAVSVKKKIGSAVERNYIKRVLKEWFRLNRHRVSGNKKYDFWIVMKHKFDKTNVQEVREILMHTLDRIRRN